MQRRRRRLLHPEVRLGRVDVRRQGRGRIMPLELLARHLNPRILSQHASEYVDDIIHQGGPERGRRRDVRGSARLRRRVCRRPHRPRPSRRHGKKAAQLVTCHRLDPAYYVEIKRVVFEIFTP